VTAYDVMAWLIIAITQAIESRLLSSRSLGVSTYRQSCVASAYQDALAIDCVAVLHVFRVCLIFGTVDVAVLSDFTREKYIRIYARVVAYVTSHIALSHGDRRGELRMMMMMMTYNCESVRPEKIRPIDVHDWSFGA